jgi:hypothetical protein
MVMSSMRQPYRQRRRSSIRKRWLLIVPLSLAGCATTIHPPPQPAEPARIAVLDHGRHASLLAEGPDGGMVRYSYGDWQWYALEQTGAGEATSAVFGPTQAALGRRFLPGPLSPVSVSQQVRVPVEDAVYLAVDRRDLDRLRERLDRIFAENSAKRIYNASYDLEFVPHPTPYSASHNSNRVVGTWLEELGCRLDGAPFLSVWRVSSRE